MKKLLTVGALTLMSVAPIFAQKGKVNTAEFNLTSGEVAKAKQNIDDAFGNAEMQTFPKAWIIKGDVYRTIYELQDIQKDLYSSTPNTLGIAKDAYFKAFEVETNAKKKGDVTSGLQSLGIHYYNEGLEKYQSQDFKAAFENFKNKVEISEFLNNNGLDAAADTMGYFVLALSAYNTQNIDEAFKAAEKLNALKNKKEDHYVVILDIFKAKGENEKYVKLVEEARKAYPNNVNLMYSEINLYLEKGELDVLVEKLKVLIDREPKNANLYLVLGTVYDRKGEKQTALSYYDKALEINPDYFDAYVNKASYYNAEANEIIEKMNDENNPNKYDALKKQRDDIFKNKMIPLLKKAYTLDPNNENVVKALKEIYARLDMFDELKELNKK